MVWKFKYLNVAHLQVKCPDWVKEGVELSISEFLGIEVPSGVDENSVQFRIAHGSLEANLALEQESLSERLRALKPTKQLWKQKTFHFQMAKKTFSFQNYCLFDKHGESK